MSNNTVKLLGILLIFVGVGYLGDQLYFWDFTIFFNGWWAVLLVLLGIYSIAVDGVNIFNTLLCVVGVYGFLHVNNVITLKITIPMIISAGLIAYGIKLLFFKEYTIEQKEFSDSIKKESQSDFSDGHAKKIYIHTTFNNRKIVEDGIVDKCRIETHFGNTYVDLSKADLRTLDYLSIESIFGDITILLPKDVNIVLGKKRLSSGCYVDTSICENGYNVTIRETAIFGNIKIIKEKEQPAS